MAIWRRVGPAVLAAVAAACAVGPNHTVPPTAVPQHWRDTTVSLQDSSYANLTWWQVLGDSTLQELVRIALRENRDLRVALARVNEARARATRRSRFSRSAMRTSSWRVESPSTCHQVRLA